MSDDTLRAVSETLELALLRYEERNFAMAKKLTRSAKAKVDMAREDNESKE